MTLNYIAQAFSNLLSILTIVKMEQSFNWVIGFMHFSYWDIDCDYIFG